MRGAVRGIQLRSDGKDLRIGHDLTGQLTVVMGFVGSAGIEQSMGLRVPNLVSVVGSPFKNGYVTSNTCF